MSTEKTWQTRSLSYENTVRLGEQLGCSTKGGEVIELISDLGGGKTAIVTGLAVGIGSEDQVSSPTFTVSRVYYGKKFTIHHFDFYRLEEAGLIAQQLAEVLDDPTAIIIVEWGNVVHDVLPQDRCIIDISKVEDRENERIITCRYTDKYDYLFESFVQ